MYITQHVIFYEIMFPFQYSFVFSIFLSSHTSYHPTYTLAILPTLHPITKQSSVPTTLDLTKTHSPIYFSLDLQHIIDQSSLLAHSILVVILVSFAKSTIEIDSYNPQHTNHHLMVITHAKVDIFKKNVFLVQKVVEPHTFK